MSYQDRTLTCRDCNREFIFTAGEQEFYASKGLQNDPARCPECRNSRKNARNALENDAGYIRYGGGASFGGRTPRQMHPAACALCGDMIEVPFIPRGDRPVFCSTVKRLMTQGYSMEEVSAKWGLRPCRNAGVRDALRRGETPPSEAEAAVPSVSALAPVSEAAAPSSEAVAPSSEAVEPTEAVAPSSEAVEPTEAIEPTEAVAPTEA